MKALIWKKAFRARGTNFMALGLLALHVHHVPKNEEKSEHTNKGYP